MALIERICENCGGTFLVKAHMLKYGRGKNCSLKCSYQSIAKKATTKFQTQCARCGKSFFTIPSKDDKYCSKKCAFPPVYSQCLNCGKTFRYSPSSRQRYCSKKCADSSSQKSETAKKNIKQQWERDREKLMEGIKRRSESDTWRNAPHFQKGEAHPRFKGNKRARDGESSQYKYKKWRKEVFMRDNYTCRECHKRGGRLEAHHIKEWAKYPELRYDVNNGKTVCIDCHNKIHGVNPTPKTRKCYCCHKRFELKKNATLFCSLKCFARFRKGKTLAELQQAITLIRASKK